MLVNIIIFVYLIISSISSQSDDGLELYYNILCRLEVNCLWKYVITKKCFFCPRTFSMSLFSMRDI